MFYHHHHQKLTFLLNCLLLILLNLLLLEVNGCIKNPLNRPSDAIESSANELADSLRDSSDRLAGSVDNGVFAAQSAVRDLAPMISELAKSVNIRVNSGDLANLGKKKNHLFLRSKKLLNHS
jgi:hypothetical protein